MLLRKIRCPGNHRGQGRRQIVFAHCKMSGHTILMKETLVGLQLFQWQTLLHIVLSSSISSICGLTFNAEKYHQSYCTYVRDDAWTSNIARTTSTQGLHPPTAVQSLISKALITFNAEHYWQLLQTLSRQSLDTHITGTSDEYLPTGFMAGNALCFLISFGWYD